MRRPRIPPPLFDQSIPVAVQVHSHHDVEYNPQTHHFLTFTTQPTSYGYSMEWIDEVDATGLQPPIVLVLGGTKRRSRQQGWSGELGTLGLAEDGVRMSIPWPSKLAYWCASAVPGMGSPGLLMDVNRANYWSAWPCGTFKRQVIGKVRQEWM